MLGSWDMDMFKATKGIIDAIWIALPAIAFGIAQLWTPSPSHSFNLFLPLLASWGGQILAFCYILMLIPGHAGVGVILLLLQASVFIVWTVASYYNMWSNLHLLGLTCLLYGSFHFAFRRMVIPDEDLGVFSDVSVRFGIVTAGLRNLIIDSLSVVIHSLSVIIDFLFVVIGLFSPMPAAVQLPPSSSQASQMPSSSQVPPSRMPGSLPSSSSQIHMPAIQSTRVSVSPPPYYDLECAYNNSLSRELRETLKL